MVKEGEQPPAPTSTPPFTIEQVAARIGLTKRTLRYYEEMGLLPPTERTEGNYRRYTEDDVQRLERIKNLRDLLGFSLADIRDILQAEDERDLLRLAYRQETDTVTKLAQLDRTSEIIQHQLELIEQKIAGLEQMRSTLQTKLDSLESKKQALQQNSNS